MQERTVRVTYGCLLHDIGKMVYRAGGESGTHSLLGRKFLKQFWPGETDILECVGLHHAGELRRNSPADDSPAWIAYVADNISAAADRREIEEGSEGGFVRSQPLVSVFTHLNGEHPGNIVLPSPQDGILRMPSKQLHEIGSEQYAAAINKIKSHLTDFSPDESWINSLLSLLETHTSMFPSSTYAGESPDISLYDHLKTTAAIGACISEYMIDEKTTDYKTRLFAEEKNFRDENAFLLYSADFSGIQKFIYMVSSDKALKSLRSRSFILELMMEHYIDELLMVCGVSRANLLYSGGGHCYILLPNTKSVKEKIELWNERFNEWLSDEFGVALYLAHGYTACSGNALTNIPAEKAPYRDVFRRVSADISKRKLHRYSADRIRRFNMSRETTGRECKICGRSDNLNNERCSWCNLFVDISEKIQSRNIYFVSAESDAGFDFELPGTDGKLYISLTDERSARERLQNGEKVRRVYSKNKAFTGLQYSTTLFVGDYALSNEMSGLAKESSGVRRIGICRMDVDNLGSSFVSGFEKKEKETVQERQHFVTISRTAAFSRQMSLFFKCYINEILSGKFGNKKELAVAIVYSGGDDVFLVGAWNDVIEASIRIREAFVEFNCGSLTISCGVCVVGDNFPIRLSAALAGELEDCAKHEPNKNSISLFEPAQNHTYDWETFENSVLGEKRGCIEKFFTASKKKNNANDDNSEQRRGNSFLYKLVDLLRTAEGNEGSLQLARYAYLLARLEPKNNSSGYNAYKEFSKNMYDWAAVAQHRKQLITAIYIYVYANREEE